ncbi:hypothetical protein D9756_002790 [Leucocoprinus leucothites]|uniref:DUF6533 domain-containing protein n=1 Tax=Leucocoprinus leucothites TaxID=201217 RepID=A0A8H5LM87_9AGAR|nr:hypothetical protein D9756_002790 [Leucoagaricus leucothites]
MSMAGLALLLYDHILTWQDEIEYFAQRKCHIFIALLHSAAECELSTVAQVSDDSNDNTALQHGVHHDNERFWVGVTLGLWYLFCRAYGIRSLLIGITQIEMDIYCIPRRSPDDSRWFCLLIVVNQAIFWYLGYWKYRSTVRDGWSNYPLIRIVIRDNSWTFLLFADETCSDIEHVELSTAVATGIF